MKADISYSTALPTQGCAPGLGLRAAALLAVLFLAGCGRDEIRVYSAPKPEAVSRPVTPARETADEEAPHLHWELPEGWQELAPTSIRLGNFSVKKGGETAQISIVRLPRIEGWELDNLNRWRREVGLSPVGTNELMTTRKAVKVGESDGALYEVEGIPPQQTNRVATLAAALDEGDFTWFIKMMGSAALVQGQRETFTEFLESLEMHGSDAHAEAKPSAESRPELPVPSTWERAAAQPPVLVRYTVRDGGELSVTSFPGDVGGMLANINRWRRQMNLEPLEEAAAQESVSPLTLGAAQATLVQLSNPATKQQMSVVVFNKAGNSWFVKLLGPAAVVEREQAALKEFAAAILKF